MNRSRKCHSPMSATLALLFIAPFFSACGLLFVEGPSSGWQGAQDIETTELTQPCTQSKALIAVDGAIGGLSTLFGVANLTANEYDKGLTVSSFFWVGILGVSVYQGNKRVNDCRAFSANLAKQSRDGVLNHASDEWFNQYFPVPDLGTNTFDPVFDISTNNSLRDRR